MARGIFLTALVLLVACGGAETAGGGAAAASTGGPMPGVTCGDQMCSVGQHCDAQCEGGVDPGVCVPVPANKFVCGDRDAVFCEMGKQHCEIQLSAGCTRYTCVPLPPGCNSCACAEFECDIVCNVVDGQVFVECDG